MKRLIVGLATTALVSAGLGMAGLAFGAGAAHADMYVPYHWCPGQPLPSTGNHITNPIVWDMGVCHTYEYVPFGQGNVAQNIWDGPDAPLPPPPAPPAPPQCGPGLLPCALFP